MSSTPPVTLSVCQVSPDQGRLLGLLVQLMRAERCIEVGVFTVRPPGSSYPYLAYLPYLHFLLSFASFYATLKEHILILCRFGTDKEPTEALNAEKGKSYFQQKEFHHRFRLESSSICTSLTCLSEFTVKGTEYMCQVCKKVEIVIEAIRM